MALAVDEIERRGCWIARSFGRAMTLRMYKSVAPQCRTQRVLTTRYCLAATLSRPLRS
jgi:hypothetical protein